jgi:hypothetical protein
MGCCEGRTPTHQGQSSRNGFRHDATDTSPGGGAPRAVAGGTPGKRIPDADLTDTTPVTASEVKPYQGRAVAMVRSGIDPARITVRATATGVAPAEVTIAAER